MFKTIVWATDGSETADLAAPYITSLAKQQEVELVVVHVVQKYASHSASGLSVYADEEKVEAKLRQIVADMADEGLDVSLKIVTHVGPQPAHEIADIARDAGADVIVVGSRGHTPIAGLVLGSVAMRLLHIAPCPVLVVSAASTRAAEDRTAHEAHATA